MWNTLPHSTPTALGPIFLICLDIKHITKRSSCLLSQVLSNVASIMSLSDGGVLYRKATSQSWASCWFMDQGRFAGLIINIWKLTKKQRRGCWCGTEPKFQLDYGLIFTESCEFIAFHPWSPVSHHTTIAAQATDRIACWISAMWSMILQEVSELGLDPSISKASAPIHCAL